MLHAKARDEPAIVSQKPAVASGIQSVKRKRLSATQGCRHRNRSELQCHRPVQMTVLY
jgi:hypothetical protein